MAQNVAEVLVGALQAIGVTIAKLKEAVLAVTGA
jgi:hypothetical protein